MIIEDLQHLYQTYTGVAAETITELPSSGSNRRYFRLTGINPAKRKAMAVKNEKRFLKQKRNALKNPGYSRHPVKTQASFKRLLKAV